MPPVAQDEEFVSFLREHGRGSENANSLFACTSIIAHGNRSLRSLQNHGTLLPLFIPSMIEDNFHRLVFKTSRSTTITSFDVRGSPFSHLVQPSDPKKKINSNAASDLLELIQDYVNASYSIGKELKYKRSFEGIRKQVNAEDSFTLFSSIIQDEQVKQKALISFFRQRTLPVDFMQYKPASGVEGKRRKLDPKGAQRYGGPCFQNLEIAKENHIDHQKVSSQALQFSVMLQNDSVPEIRVSKQTTNIPLEDLLSDSKFVSVKLRGHALDALILTFAHMKPCHMGECEKFGKYQHRELNSIGMCCNHYDGSPACGRFFPSTYASFVNGSNPENILSHVGHVCQACPPQIREAIQELERRKVSNPLKLRYGSRKRFFSYFWNRIHPYVTKLPLIGEESPLEGVGSSKEAIKEAKGIASDLGCTVSEPNAKRARPL